jgi:ubiquinone/menaquinone biosynthesis C-methylase UbiE
MLKNRYDDILREYNQDIIGLSPANQTMRIELALEIKKILEEKPDVKILEIGVGEGDLTKYILQYNSEIKLDCLDISNEMIDSARKNL